MSHETCKAKEKVNYIMKDEIIDRNLTSYNRKAKKYVYLYVL